MFSTSLQVKLGKMHEGTESKAAWLVSIGMLSCVTVGSLFYFAFANQIIESAYKGQSIEFLNKLIADHRMSRPWGTLEHYFTLGRLLFSRILFICIAMQLIVLAILKYRYVLKAINRFFTEATHPINLAIFRVVLFYTIFDSVDVSYVTWLSQLPADLRVPPIGVGWLLDHLPPNPTWTEISARLLLVCSFTAMMGLFTRSSALLTVVLSFYVLGIPNFYGKVDHTHHHLLWFAAILAPSRCGDALSCDAILGAWKRADRGVTESPGSSQAYALPLRFVWLVLGLTYFFAGFWKFWGSGLDWALSDNLKFIMYQKWFDLGGWTPSFRIDRYPLLYKLGAVGTILFEISFVFLIFSRRLRLLAPLAGLVFHTMTDIFMRISFKELLRCYVVFFDWNAIFRRIGRWLYQEEMYVLYDGNCKFCRRAIASLRVFDLLERLTYVSALDQNAIKDHRLHLLDSTAFLRHMYVVVDEKSWAGFLAYRALGARIPLFWPVWPFLYLWPIPKIGSRIYRHTADSRTCDIPNEPSEYREAGYRLGPSSGAVKAIGVLLLCGNFLAGVTQNAHAWPFSMYPSFEGIATPETNSVEISAVDTTGIIIPLTPQTASRILPLGQYRGQISFILSTIDQEEGRHRLRALGQRWRQNDSRLQQATSIQLYRTTVSTVPERLKDNPIHRELLLELQL